jgi:hypothetical protein
MLISGVSFPFCFKWFVGFWDRPRYMEIFWLRHAETRVAAAVYSIPKFGKLAPGVVAQFWLKVEDL